MTNLQSSGKPAGGPKYTHLIKLAAIFDVEERIPFLHTAAFINKCGTIQLLEVIYQLYWPVFACYVSIMYNM